MCARTEVLEAWKKVENSMVSMAAVGLAVGAEATAEASAACTAAQGMLSVLFPPVLLLLNSRDNDVAMAGVPLLHAYVGKLKAGLKRAGNQLPEVSQNNGGGGGGGNRIKGRRCACVWEEEGKVQRGCEQEEVCVGGEEPSFDVFSHLLPSLFSLLSWPVWQQVQRQHVAAIMAALTTCASYPGDLPRADSSSSPPEPLNTEDDVAEGVGERRSELWTLLKNTARVAPEEVYGYVGERARRMLAGGGGGGISGEEGGEGVIWLPGGGGGGFVVRGRNKGERKGEGGVHGSSACVRV